MKALIQIMGFLTVLVLVPHLRAQPTEEDMQALDESSVKNSGKKAESDKASSGRKAEAKNEDHKKSAPGSLQKQDNAQKNVAPAPPQNSHTEKSGADGDVSLKQAKTHNSRKASNKNKGVGITQKAHPSSAAKAKTAKKNPPKAGQPSAVQVPVKAAQKASSPATAQQEKNNSSAGSEQHALLNLNSLQNDFAKLVKAKDKASLSLFCESRRAHEVIKDRRALGLWQKLCRAEALRMDGDFAGARKKLTELLHERRLKDPDYLQAQRSWNKQAKFSLAGMARTEFLQFRPCLAELGDGKRARAESALWEKQRAVAEEAYRDIVQDERGDARLSALLEIIKLSDAFYRRLTGPNISLRSVSRPPPRHRYFLRKMRLMQAVLGPKHSELRSSIVLAYTKLLRQARSQGARAELIEKIRAKQAEFKKYQPKLPEKVVPDWPPRSGNRGKIKAIKPVEGGYVLTTIDGKELKLSNDKALKRMRDLAAMLEKGFWAPQAFLELARMKDTDSLPLLMQAAQIQSDPELQTAAIYALGELADPASLPTLFSLFRTLREKSSRALFDTPAHTFFAQQERLLDAIANIGKSHPQSVQSLLEDGYLPSEEAAYVLWAAKSKSLYGAYIRMREHAKPGVAAYGIMALVDLQGETARWMLNDRDTKDPLLRCVKVHLRESLK